MNTTTVLPDGSAFSTVNFQLPKDHWLYAPSALGWNNERNCSTDQPIPFLTHEDKQKVIEAARYAIRASTMNGAEKDFDPDAMVQNMVVALCGNYPVKAKTT